MPLFNNLLNMGAPKIRYDRVSWPSKVDLVVSPDGIWLERSQETSEVSLMGAARTAGYEPRPFIDDVEATFGINVSEVKKEIVVTKTPKSKVKHDSYVTFLSESDCASDPAVKKLIEFLSDNPYDMLLKTMDTVDLNKILYEGMGAIRIVSTFEGYTVLAEKYADQFSGVETEDVVCSVTGEVGKAINLKYEKLSRIVGSSPTGMVMASANTSAIPSIRNYNFENLDGSPMSAQTYSTILRNLQSLINNKKNYIRIPNSPNDSYIIVYDNVSEELQSPVSGMLMDIYKPEDLVELGVMDEDPADECTEGGKVELPKVNPADIIYKKYQAVRKGKYYTASAKGTVTCYRIHCVKARWSCTGEFTINVADMCKNIDTWYNDTITAGLPHSIMSMLRSALPKDGKVNARDYESVMHTILFGKDIKNGLLDRVINRISFSGKQMTYNQYALVKACYNNSARRNNKKEFSDMLDKTRTDFAYNMGRLLALGDYLQRKCNSNISSPISGRLDARARNRPNDCRQELLGRLRMYCNQLIKNNNTRGTAIFGLQLMDEILSVMQPHNNERMSTDEQAELSVGCIQQNGDFYKSNKTNNQNNED